MKTPAQIAKLVAIHDILMDPDYQRSKKQNLASGMGTATPGKSKISQYSPKKKKSHV